MLTSDSRATSARAAKPPPLYGTNPNAVIAAIKARGEHLRRGTRANDGHKIGLVIEGGGMRGTCSGGGAVALAHLGYGELFDEVYATSAGVMNASYFLSGQPELGISVYFDCLASREFVNPARFWKIIDIDYVFDHVVTVAKPLDVGRVLASPSRFFVALMDHRASEAFMVDTKTTRAPLLRVLKAATAIPVFYNRSVEVEGRPCMDAGLCIPFPIEEALANGCTDVLVMLTRPVEYICQPPKWWQRFMYNLLCGRGNRRLRQIYAKHHEREIVTRDLAFGRSMSASGANIATICTDDGDVITRTTTDPAAIRAAAVSYGRKTLRVFGVDAPNWDLTPLAGEEQGSSPSRPLPGAVDFDTRQSASAS